MNIFLTGSFKIRVESIEILLITSSLRERISVVPSTFFISRHPMTIYRSSCVHFRGLYRAGTTARGSKLPEKFSSNRFWAVSAMCTGLPYWSHLGAEGAEKKIGYLDVIFIDFLNKIDDFIAQIPKIFPPAAGFPWKTYFWCLKWENSPVNQSKFDLKIWEIWWI